MFKNKFIKSFMLAACLPLAAMFTACGDDEPDTPSNPDDPTPPVTDQVVFSASADQVIANGTDQVEFTVTANGTDVTESSIIMCNSKKMEGYAFSTTVAGTYEFYAVYDNDVTDKITITAIADPERYDGFRHRALAIQSTGTWCGFCPRLTAGMYLFSTTDENPDDVVFATAHNGDALTSDAANLINNYIGVSGLPSMKMNLDPQFTVMTNQTPEIIAKNIRQSVTTAFRTPARSCIKASVSEPDGNGNINVTADIKIGVQGDYRVAAWLLEDDLYGKQNDTQRYGQQYGLNVDYHENVVRAISSNLAQGSLLGSTAGVPAKSVQSFTHTFNVNNCGVKDPSKCHVIVLVTYANSGIFTVDNVVNLDLGASCDYEYSK